jgi:hypothetical protein
MITYNTYLAFRKLSCVLCAYGLYSTEEKSRVREKEKFIKRSWAKHFENEKSVYKEIFWEIKIKILLVTSNK